MLEPCLKCGAENGVWARFCGPCGADLAAVVQSAAKEFQADRERIDGLRKASRFTDARACLERMANANHPRLSQYAAWAKETLAQVDAELETATRRRDASVQQAESLMVQRDFAAAASVLQEISEAVRTPKSAELLRQAQAALAEIDGLRDDIRSGVAGNQFKDLKPKAIRLRELQPNDSVAGDVLQQLKGWEDQRDANVKQAERLMAQRDFAAAVPVLQGIVEAVRTPKSAELLWKSQEALSEVSALRNEIRSRAAAQQFKDLKPKAVRLCELQPNDSEAQSVLRQFKPWEEQRDASIEQAESPMRKHDYAAAVKVLQGIPAEAQTLQSASRLREAEAAVGKIAAMRDDVRSRAAAKQFKDLRPVVVQLLNWQPHDSEAEGVLQQIKAREDQRDATLRQAETLIATHDFAAAVKLLQAIPEVARSAEWARWLQRAETTAAEINGLSSEIRSRLATSSSKAWSPRWLACSNCSRTTPRCKTCSSS